jgi:PIN domain nuclease of toxin-antitoxin system
MTEALLLDTCAAIWLAEDQPVSNETVQALDKSAANGQAIYVSSMSAWEIGLLTARGRLTISVSAQSWFEQLLAIPGVNLADLSIGILIASSFLPGDPPRDPADRIIAATAREHGYRLVTRDRVLLDYAAQGHMKALAC